MYKLTKLSQDMYLHLCQNEYPLEAERFKKYLLKGYDMTIAELEYCNSFFEEERHYKELFTANK